MAHASTSEPRTGPHSIGVEAGLRPIRSYVLRTGRITDAQQRALRDHSQWLLPFSASPPDWHSVFAPRHQGEEVIEAPPRSPAPPLILEIGSGMGEATARIAAQQPHTHFLAVEVHLAGVGALLQRIAQMQLSNLRVVRHDAVDVLRRMIGHASLAGVHVFFPDPWHKKRHHKRRLIQPDFVRLLASRVATGGYLHMATDWLPYAEHMREVMGTSDIATFWRFVAGLAAQHGSARPKTKFEQRGVRLAHTVTDLVYARR